MRKGKSTRRRHSIYIIELSRACMKEACAFAPLYVGQTAHTSQTRSREEDIVSFGGRAQWSATEHPIRTARMWSLEALYDPTGEISDWNDCRRDPGACNLWPGPAAAGRHQSV